MKYLFIILVFIGFESIHAQDVFPKVLNIESSDNKTIKETYTFLMLNSKQGIDLKNYGNDKCEYKLLTNNENKVLLEYNQPSKLNPKGRCASGTEKGFLFFKFDDNSNLIESKSYLIESCLLSIENTNLINANSETMTYICENIQTSEYFKVKVDLKNILIQKD